MVMYIKIGEESAAMRLALSDAARELKDRLAEGDIVYTADDYGGFEKVGELGFSLLFAAALGRAHNDVAGRRNALSGR